jgi:lipopolysaccharide export system ATP-binding protein
MSDNSELVLHTKDLVKRYKNRTVVKGVSVEVRQGEIVGLLGPNGAGKTTTFYMIVGLIQPNEGEIYLNEDLITREPVYKRAQKGIGYLAQEASVFRNLSVEDNIEKAPRYPGTPSLKVSKLRLSDYYSLTLIVYV